MTPTGTAQTRRPAAHRRGAGRPLARPPRLACSVIAPYTRLIRDRPRSKFQSRLYLFRGVLSSELSRCPYRGASSARARSLGVRTPQTRRSRGVSCVQRAVRRQRGSRQREWLAHGGERRVQLLRAAFLKNRRPTPSYRASVAAVPGAVFGGARLDRARVLRDPNVSGAREALKLTLVNCHLSPDAEFEVDGQTVCTMPNSGRVTDVCDQTNATSGQTNATSRGAVTRAAQPARRTAGDFGEPYGGSRSGSGASDLTVVFPEPLMRVRIQGFRNPYAEIETVRAAAMSGTSP